mgnify:CR=1 FL=1
MSRRRVSNATGAAAASACAAASLATSSSMRAAAAAAASVARRSAPARRISRPESSWARACRRCSVWFTTTRASCRANVYGIITAWYVVPVPCFGVFGTVRRHCVPYVCQLSPARPAAAAVVACWPRRARRTPAPPAAPQWRARMQLRSAPARTHRTAVCMKLSPALAREKDLEKMPYRRGSDEELRA